MKILFKSPEKTSVVIIALRERRDKAIKELSNITERAPLPQYEKDIKMLSELYTRIINECNDVLDILGTD